MELKGSTALLTGASGGLGRAIAVALADRGVSLILSSRKPEELERLAGELPGEHRTVVADLAEEGAALELLDAAGDIDILVANAGLPASGRLDGFSQEEIGRALTVNLEVPVRMTRELVPRLEGRGRGHLVYVSSLAGKVSTPRSSLYAATKFGLRGFALCLREDLRGTGVGVSVITPGVIRSAGMYADSRAKHQPLIGTGTPEQVGAAVVRAIEKNRNEISVAPVRQRALTRMGMIAPEIAGRVAGRRATEVADEIARGQADKR